MGATRDQVVHVLCLMGLAGNEGLQVRGGRCSIGRGKAQGTCGWSLECELVVVGFQNLYFPST